MKVLKNIILFYILFSINNFVIADDVMSESYNNYNTIQKSEWIKSVSYGISYVELFDTNMNPQLGFSADFMLVRKFSNILGLRIGADIGLDMFLLENDKDLNSDIGYTMDLSLIGGYNLKDKFDIPIEFILGIGYQFGYIGSNTVTGINYQSKINWLLTKKYGIGVEYKNADLKMYTLLGYLDMNTNLYSIFIDIKL